MTQTEISNFLQAGAFFGGTEDPCFVMTGLQALPNSAHSEFDLAYQEFFGSELKSLKASTAGLWVERKVLRAALSAFLAENPLQEPLLQAKDFTLPSQSEYSRAFADIQDRIRSGGLKKAVPVVFARKDFTPAEGVSAPVPVSLAQRAAWLLALLELPPGRLYLYGIWDEQSGILGATPEVLFSLKNHQVQTMALAGTLPKSERGQRLPLSEDPKETYEHQLVVDDLKTQLGLLGQVQVGRLETLELPTLFHLQTRLQVEIEEDHSSLSAPELVTLLHPTPALGVSPRSAGHHWLAHHPGQEHRGVFGGPLVFRLGPDEVIGLVAIRNIQWSPHGLQVGTGGGVVADSQLDREWAELGQKREAVFKSLGM